jgi:hypothetical protein
MLEGMKGPSKKELQEMEARHSQAHAAVHGERNTCETALNCALDYLAQDVGLHLSKMCEDREGAIEVLRDIRAAVDKVRKNLRKDLLAEDGQISQDIFVELQPWRKRR